MAAISALPLEYNWISSGLLDSQSTIEYGFRYGLTPKRC